VLRGRGRVALYVGKSTRLFARLGEHLNDPRTQEQAKVVDIIPCSDEADMDAKEKRYIHEFNALWNIHNPGGREYERLIAKRDGALRIIEECDKRLAEIEKEERNENH